MKKIVYNYLKPQNYYNRLFTFFMIISISLTFALVGFDIDFEVFLLKFFVICFLLLAISVFVEMFNHGEYMSPIEVYDVEFFFNEFMMSVYDGRRRRQLTFFNKYDHKSKKKFDNLFDKNKRYLLSTIIKHDKVYELTFINEKKMAEYFLFKFLIRRAIHRMEIRKIKNQFKIVRFS